MTIKLKTLREQVIVVTGATSGNGLATVEEAVTRGAAVVAVARNAAALETLRHRLAANGGRTKADAPYALPYPNAKRFRETIVLPDGGRGYALDPLAFNQTIAGVATHREGRIVNGVAEVETDTNSLAPEYPASEAAAAQQLLRHQLHEHVYLRRPGRTGVS